MCDELNTEKLSSIINKFLCCVPVSEIGLKDCLSSIFWNEQAFLLDRTVNNTLIKKYPVKISYQKAFLKEIINILENNSVEIYDNLYDTYCNLLSTEDKEKFYYKHYNIDKKIITLKENKNFISEGTTGLCSWQASLALSQWCLNNKKYLENKEILELGSGVGLVGLTTIIHCQPKSFYLSDCHPKVLSILSENIQLNITSGTEVEIKSDIDIFSDNINIGSASRGLHNTVSCSVNPERTSGDKFDNIQDVSCGLNTIKGTFDGDSIREINVSSGLSTTNSDCSSENILLSTVKNNCKVYVVNLAWESVEDNYFIKPDLILAADVVYDNSVFKPLCGAVKFYLDFNPECEVVFACTERNTDTLNEFLQLLESNNFRITNLNSPTPEKFFWSTTVPIRFYKVTTK